MQTPPQRLMSVQNFIKDGTAIQYYTGLEDYDTFKFILQTLGPAAQFLTYYGGFTPSIDIEDQFFLTLMKLRRGTPSFELSRGFGLSQTGVSNVFITWINFLSAEWGGGGNCSGGLQESL